MSGINQLESLRIFKAVVEGGSFSAAAKQLNVSAAWVSKSIERLEAQLDTTLFHRTTRHMQITENGERCYLRGLELLNQWQSLEEEVSLSEESPQGKIRINAPTTWGLCQIGPVLTDFMRKYPDIVLDVQLSDRYVNVMEEQYDLVLRLASQLADSSLLCQKITSYKRVVCASPDYLQARGIPQHPEELREHACLVYASQTGNVGWWPFTEGRKTLDIYLEPRLLSNNSQFLRSALLEGCGIALIPDFIVGDDIAEGRLISILDGFQTSALNLYSLRAGNRRMPYRLKLLHSFLVESFG